jgi:hypothetical protein
VQVIRLGYATAKIEWLTVCGDYLIHREKAIRLLSMVHIA